MVENLELYRTGGRASECHTQSYRVSMDPFSQYQRWGALARPLRKLSMAFALLGLEKESWPSWCWIWQQYEMNWTAEQWTVVLSKSQSNNRRDGKKSQSNHQRGEKWGKMVLLKTSLQKIKQQSKGTEYRPHSPGKLGQQRWGVQWKRSGRILNSHLRKECTGTLRMGFWVLSSSYYFKVVKF